MIKRILIPIGTRIGRLVIIEDLGTQKIGNQYRPMVRAKCDCGTVRDFIESNLRRGKTRACGCLRKELSAARARSMRLYKNSSKDSRYGAWNAMRDRCLNPKNKEFHRYGGRGITICERWSNFDVFVSDMGERPHGTSIDRIDNDGNYEPGNCRWADRITQARNTSRVVLVNIFDQKLPLSEAAKLTGRTPAAVRGLARRRGWGVQTVIDYYASTPKIALTKNGRPLRS